MGRRIVSRETLRDLPHLACWQIQQHSKPSPKQMTVLQRRNFTRSAYLTPLQMQNGNEVGVIGCRGRVCGTTLRPPNHQSSVPSLEGFKAVEAWLRGSAMSALGRGKV